MRMRSARREPPETRPDGFPVRAARVRSDHPLISLVLPVYNERHGLPVLIEGLQGALNPLNERFELIFVNDGSSDGSTEWLSDLAAADRRVSAVHLSRNFGHQAAVQAGLAESRGDAVVVMDSDLQDDPRAIARFLAAWRDGYDVVYAIRTQRKEAWWKRLLFSTFYQVLRRVADVPIPTDAGNFGLMDRRVVQVLLELPERDRYFAGLRSWVGYRQLGIPVERLSRYDGHPRVSLWRLFLLAKTALLSFSSLPVLFFYAVSVSALALSAGLLLIELASVFSFIAPSNGLLLYAVLSFGAGLNALGLAVLGDYLLQILAEVRGRPSYCIDQVERGRHSRVSRHDGPPPSPRTLDSQPASLAGANQ